MRKGTIRGRIELAITLGTILIIAITVVNSVLMTKNNMVRSEKQLLTEDADTNAQVIDQWLLKRQGLYIPCVIRLRI